MGTDVFGGLVWGDDPLIEVRNLKVRLDTIGAANFGRW